MEQNHNFSVSSQQLFQGMIDKSQIFALKLFEKLESKEGTSVFARELTLSSFDLVLLNEAEGSSVLVTQFCRHFVAIKSIDRSQHKT